MRLLSTIIITLYALSASTQVKLKQIEYSDEENQIILTDTEGRPYYFYLDSLGVAQGVSSTIFSDGNTLFHSFNQDTTAVVLKLCGDGTDIGSNSGGTAECAPQAANEFNNTTSVEDRALTSPTTLSSTVTNEVNYSNLSDCNDMKGFYIVESVFAIAGAQVADYTIRIKASVDNGPATVIAEKFIYNNVGDYEQDYYLSKRVPITINSLSAKSVEVSAELTVGSVGVGENPEWRSVEIDLSLFAASHTVGS